MAITRRRFVETAAMAAGGMMAGCGTTGAVKDKDSTIWAVLFHMGANMWFDFSLEE